MTIDDTEKKQDEFNVKLGALNRYFPRIENYIEAKNTLLDNAKNFNSGEKKLLKVLKKKYFC